LTENQNLDIFGKEFKCLDKGFVRLIDVMGDDSAIVQAARVSYGKGTKSVRQDRELIRYLMRHRHTSPFEMVEFKFHVKLPIFVARQWIRHRTANVNEYSGRYSQMKDEFYVPDREQVRLQNKFNRQGRSDETLDDTDTDSIIANLSSVQNMLFTEYNSMLEKDIARELARINLPLSTYTEWYWKIDLHNLLHFLKLRMDDHAQYEIRVYANVIKEIATRFVPMTIEAFEDYILGSRNFSRQELAVLKELMGKVPPDIEMMKKYDLEGLESREFIAKLNVFFDNI
jgi:thymidylate synthase (FAD)